jgi:PAS domain S-box-containing protein
VGGLPLEVADRAEEILASLLGHATEGVVITDSSRRILMYSEGARQIFGYAPEEILGRPLEQLVPEARRASHRRLVAAFADGERASLRMSERRDIFARTRQGELVPVEVGVSKLSTPRGLLFTAIVRDISERKRAETALAAALQEAEAASRAKSAFLAAMSHEIRTPLNGVLGMTQAMAAGPLSPEQRARLAVVQDSGQGLLALLNDLLDLSKIEAGRLELEVSEFALREIVEGVAQVFRPLASQKGLRLDTVMSAHVAKRYAGDALRLRQILYNLVGNATKFTTSGGVTLDVRQRRGMLRLQVRDTGPGIPLAYQSRLFREFEQGDPSVARRHGGTGLGLAICARLTGLMGGRISVRSAPGAGAAFTVHLPLQPVAGEAPAPAATAAAAAAAAAGLSVLVAEDNPTNQLVIETLLTQLGLKCRVVGDGLAAVTAWSEEAWDLVLMDVHMPGMDGPTAAGVIRAREQAEGRARTPILALTANAMSHQLDEYRQAGMDDLIAKPIEVPTLAAAIARWTTAPCRAAA